MSTALCGEALCENVDGSFLCICPSDSEEFDPITSQCRPQGNNTHRDLWDLRVRPIAGGLNFHCLHIWGINCRKEQIAEKRIQLSFTELICCAQRTTHSKFSLMVKSPPVKFPRRQTRIRYSYWQTWHGKISLRNTNSVHCKQITEIQGQTYLESVALACL